jgi:uncharacterized protein involved in exopolysaccharide biosynthesis
MVSAANPAIPDEDSPAEEEHELQRLKEQALLLVRAPRRHPRLAVLTTFCVLLLGLGFAIFAPRWYRCDARILAQRNLVLPALGNPKAVPREGDSPSKNAADTILERDSIVALIKQLDLIDRWQATRQPAQRLKDRIVARFKGPRSDDDRLMDLVGFLQKQVTVGADDSSVTISVEWPDRELAYEIVAFLQKRFLEARYDASVDVVREAIRILEERAKPEAAEVDAALADLVRIETQRRDALHGRPVVRARVAFAPAPVARAHPAWDDLGDDTAQQLEDVRRRIRVAREDRQRQLLQAQSQLADARATLGPMHPTVVALGDKIAQLGGSPPELQALLARERQLSPHAAPSPAPGAPASPGPSFLPPVVAAGSPAAIEARLRDDPEVVQALARLQGVSAKYDEMLARIEAANIELEVTRAAFKYQYAVVRPAELPRDPSRPSLPLVALLSILAAALLCVLVPGALDLLGGRFVEGWQLQQKLDLPLLGELTAPR